MSRSPSGFLVVLTLAACAPPVVPAPPAAPLPTDPAGLVLERPLPHPVVPPLGFQEAVARGTRTTTGVPGPNYWQQRTDYRILANLDTRARQLQGSAQIRYRNESPDSLGVLVLHLHQNLHRPGVVRNEPVVVTEGMTIERMRVAGQTLRRITTLQQPGPGYALENTLLVARPAAPVLPGSTTTIEIDWSLEIPQSGAGRMGWDADNLYFIAYWYPQMAVYDDVGGWHTDPYRGRGEFYMGYGDYDVTLTVPHGWVVRATGELQNPAEVLPPEILARLERGARSDTVVHVLTAADFGPGSATLRGPDGTLDWSFRATNVRDFTFSATSRSLWDVSRAAVGDRTGDGRQEYTRVESLWRQPATRWSHVWRYAQHSITFLSRFTGFPYPWPHMTAVEGANIIGGGMEFPMMTVMGDYAAAGDAALYGVTAHEIAHMWIPMIVGSDERRYGWLDEGATNFAEVNARDDFFSRRGAERENYEQYLPLARRGAEGEIMRWTDFHETMPAWAVATYPKPAMLLSVLRELIGEEAFFRGYRGFIESWAYRHPTPWDFFHAFDTAAGRSLEWFWRTWYHETWTLDQAVANVSSTAALTTIEVHDLGTAPMPARLSITLADGETLRREIPVSAWLAGARTATVTLPAEPAVVRVEIDPELAFPDVDRTNNVWTAP
jgi:hypothetical protein